jgi:hypothetical protein
MEFVWVATCVVVDSYSNGTSIAVIVRFYPMVEKGVKDNERKAD